MRIKFQNKFHCTGINLLFQRSSLNMARLEPLSVEHTKFTYLSNSVVTTGVVVRRVFLSADNLLRMVQLTVGSGADLVADRRFEIDVHCTRNVLSGTSFAEKGVKSVISASGDFVSWHLAIWLNSVFKAVQFPAAVSGLDTSLAHVD
jgi:hypothetical protein